MSPFQHVPAIPAAPFQLMPVIWLMVAAAALVAAGVLATEHRDIG